MVAGIWLLREEFPVMPNSAAWWGNPYETDGDVRIIGSDGCETVKNTTSTSCYRMDGSYVSHLSSDESHEWRAVEYVGDKTVLTSQRSQVRRFKSGDVKVRLTLIETSITMLCCDVGTVKHLKKPTHCTQKYCVEWGKVARQRSRQAAAAV
uniref:Ricin B-type lectin domain-containing protein n=1 Tax=Ascaris lumbricoides TaxID=6252 RepID=A0A0M3I4U9_ASCLU